MYSTVPFVDPAEMFAGVVLIAAPHMDDEVLACGSTIARLPDKDRIHCVYATDGAKSSAPVFPWMGSGSIAAELASVRMQEAKAAMRVLGVPEKNLHFLCLPDTKLTDHMRPLYDSLTTLFRALKPSCVLIPFRYDRHPDHLALNRAATAILRTEEFQGQIFEYFVYYRWALLPGRDLRRYIRPDQLVSVEAREYAIKKQLALECYTSQTTRFATWQDRAVIPHPRVVEVACSPECFLRYDPQFTGSVIFTRAASWIRLVHLIEPALKRQKERIRGLIRLKLSQKEAPGSTFDLRG